MTHQVPADRVLLGSLLSALLQFATLFLFCELSDFTDGADSRTETQTLASRPNIVFILADDQCYRDFGFMGNDLVQTPHIDRLAAAVCSTNAAFC